MQSSQGNALNLDTIATEAGDSTDLLKLKVLSDEQKKMNMRYTSGELRTNNKGSRSSSRELSNRISKQAPADTVCEVEGDNVMGSLESMDNSVTEVTISCSPSGDKYQFSDLSAELCVQRYLIIHSFLGQ